MFVRISLFFLLALGVITGCTKTDSESEVWHIKSVTDGDTFTAIYEGKEENIRLCGIDAPEMRQPLGKDAKRTLEALLKKANGAVELEVTGRDRYERLIAEALIIDRSGGQEWHVNTELLIAGMAFVYPQYVDDCPNSNIYRSAEAVAKENVLGVWKSSDFEKPWEFRKQS